MWLNMVAAHQFAVALPWKIDPATTRIAVSFIMVDIGRMLHSPMKW